MENDSKLGAAADEGVTNDLMVVNELLYKIPPDLNITQVRTQKKYVADQHITKWSNASSIRFTLQTGLEYVDMKHSTLEMDLKTTINTTYLDKKTAKMDNQTLYVDGNNLPNIIDNLAAPPSIEESWASRLTPAEPYHPNGNIYMSGALSQNASTSGGIWYIDGGMSLFDRVEIAHASGKIIQYQQQLGKIANIKHVMEYTYKRTPLSSQKSVCTREGLGEQLATPFLNDVQSELDGYQFIETLANLSESKAQFPLTQLINRDTQDTDPRGWEFKGADYPTDTVTKFRSAYRMYAGTDVKYMATSNATMYRDWAPGQVATYEVKTHMSIPMNRIPGLFEHPQLLPAQLLSGMKISFYFRDVGQCLTFVYNNGRSQNMANKLQPLGNALTGTVVSRNFSAPAWNGALYTESDEGFLQLVLANQGCQNTQAGNTLYGLYTWPSLVQRTSQMVMAPADRQSNDSFLGDVSLITGTKTDIKQEHFTHQVDVGKSTIENATLVLDCYQLAPAIQRKLDTIAASGQMRIAFPHYIYQTMSAPPSVFSKGNVFQLPVNVATENALWAFVGFRPTSNDKGSFSPLNMANRYLPWLMDSFQARAGSYYFPADPVEVGNSGTWRDLLPFAKQGLMATGRLNTNNPGGVMTSELLPEFFKLWYDFDGGNKLANELYPTRYHVPCNTMCGYWTSLERSSVLDNTGLPLNQNRQLTFQFKGGIPQGENLFSTTKTGPTSKNYGNLIDYSAGVALTDLPSSLGATWADFSVKDPCAVGIANNLDFLHLSGAASLWSSEAISVDVWVATVQYMTILLNTIVKRE